MADDIYRCPKCGSGMVARKIVSAGSKGLNIWEAPLNEAAGDLDVCTNCGHEWLPIRPGFEEADDGEHDCGI